MEAVLALGGGGVELEKPELDRALGEGGVEVEHMVAAADMDTLQELVRRLRKAGAKSDYTRGCGVHIHIGAKGHTAQTLRNLANIMASHESLLADALSLDPLELPLPALDIPGRPGVVAVAVGGILEPPGAEELGASPTTA